MHRMIISPLLLALLATSARAAEPAAVPSITVQGSCTTGAAPDRGRVYVGAEATGPDAARTAAAAITQYNQFRAALDKLDLPDRNLTSSGVQTERNTDERNGRVVTTGYTSRAGITVETSSLAGLARVMQDAASAGMASIGAMDLFLSDKLRTSLEQHCLPLATQDASLRAKALLAGLGATLGPVLSVTAGDVEQPPPRPVFAARAAAMMAPAPDLAGGTQTVSVTATVVFAIGK